MPSQLRTTLRCVLPWRGRLAVAGTVAALAVTGLGLPGAHAEAPLATVVDTPAAGPQQIVVRWKDSAGSAARSSARTAARIRTGPSLGDADFELVKPKAGQTVTAALSDLRADPRVASADADHYLSTLSMPDDPDLPKQWALQPENPTTSASSTSGSAGAIDVGPAWDRTVGTPSTVVAVIDGGYNFDNPDLSPVVWTNPGETPGNGIDDDGNGYVDDVHGWDFVGANLDQPAGDNDPTDDDPVGGGHGAHVAGIIGARGDDGQGITGVAQDVRIMPLRACSRTPLHAANQCLLSAIVQAINYAGANGARVANLSLGGSQYDQVMADALASNPRTLYVVAAGNDALDNGKHPVYPCDYVPTTDSKVAGRIDNVICVAALDQAGKPATFTNTGATSVDIAAPGVDIWSIYRRYVSSVVWSDDFEGDDFATRWINDDPGFGVAAGGDGPLVSHGLTDSPGTAPIAGEHHVRTQSFTVPADVAYCAVSGERFAKLTDSEDFSYSLWVDGADQPSSYSLAVTWTNQVLKTFSTDVFDASGMAGKQVSLHVDYTAPEGLDDSYGVWLDNLKVTCGADVDPAPYQYLSGTSMATPMVTGGAALLFSLKPSATVAQVRSAILGSAKKSSAWKGKVATGGRLDVAAAMGRLAPPDTEFVAAPAVAGQTVSLNAEQRGDLASITFQCRIDAGAFVPCNPKGVIHGVHPGRHVFSVRAVDLYGNVDPTPANASFTVTGCQVPQIRGNSLARVRAIMPRTGCVLGQVVKPAGVSLKKLRVKYVAPYMGAYLPAGTRVKVVLVRVR